MLYPLVSQPFFESSPEPGPGSESVGTNPVASPGSVSSFLSAPVKERSLAPPTQGKGVEIEGFGDDGEGVGGQGEAPPAPVEDLGDIFSDDFDLEKVPESLRSSVEKAREQWKEKTSSLPAPDVLQDAFLRAAGFNKIIESEAFKRFLDQNPEYGGEYSEDGKPSQSLDQAASMDPNLAKVLQSFDDEQKVELQKYFDQLVKHHTDPIARSYYADKAEAALNGLIEKHGEETWKANEKAVLQVMQQYRVPVEKAFNMVMGERLLQQEKSRKQEEIRAKAKHAPLGNGGPVKTTAAPASTRPARSIREAISRAEEQYMAGEAWSPSGYGPHSGR